jgi:hypothetical protein
MPMPNDYTVPVPDISGSLSQISDALDQRREKKRLSEIGGMIQTGNLSGAAGAAYASGDLGTGIDLTKLDESQKKNAMEIIGKGVWQANTPELWGNFINSVEKQTGKNLSQYRDPSNRKALLLQFPKDDPEFGSIGAGGSIFDKSSGRIVATAPKSPSGPGMSVTLPDGTVMQVGGGNNAPLGKPAEGDIQKRSINAAEIGSRLAGIMQGYDAKYLTIGNRIGNEILSGWAKLNPNSLDEHQKKELGDFAEFKSDSIGNLNSVMNELSGAAVSDQEAGRIRAQFPNPGTGIFDGDDPVSFARKANKVIDNTNKALARYQYYQLVGVPSNLEEIPLNDVKKVGSDWFVKVNGEWGRIGG